MIGICLGVSAFAGLGWLPLRDPRIVRTLDLSHPNDLQLGPVTTTKPHLLGAEVEGTGIISPVDQRAASNMHLVAAVEGSN